MSCTQQLVLPQSTTTVANTPPTTGTQTPRSQNDRLELYNSLFGQSNNSNTDLNTGLQLASSLNYSLYTFLHLSDTYWVLAMLDIDGLKDINEKLGYQGANDKIDQIGTVIKKFCDNDSRKLKGFKCNDAIVGKGDLFAILMYCHPKLIKSEKYITKLMKRIKSLTHETVSVGIAKMLEWETFDEWKLRALNNINKVKDTSSKGNDAFYSDINIKFVNTKAGLQNDDEKQGGEQAQGQGKQGEDAALRKLGTKKEFDEKMKEIANNKNEKENW